MLDRLPESTPVRQRSALQLGGAVTIHAAVIAAAMIATRDLAARPSAPSPAETTLTYLAPSAQPVRRAVTRVGGDAGGPEPLAPPDAPALPPGPVIVAGIPAIAPSTVPDGGPTRGWRPGPSLPMSELPRGDALPGAATVDEPVVALHGPEPRYPAALRAAGVEGTVRLHFVVDSAGAVVGASIRASAATQDAFVAPAVAAIREWRFRPARLDGRAVAQQVVQLVRFRLDH